MYILNIRSYVVGTPFFSFTFCFSSFSEFSLVAISLFNAATLSINLRSGGGGIGWTMKYTKFILLVRHDFLYLCGWGSTPSSYCWYATMSYTSVNEEVHQFHTVGTPRCPIPLWMRKYTKFILLVRHDVLYLCEWGSTPIPYCRYATMSYTSVDDEVHQVHTVDTPLSPIPPRPM